MGMYTEIFFRAVVDKEIVPFLEQWRNEYLNIAEPLVLDVPDHELFRCARWANLMGNNHSYIPLANGSTLEQWDAGLPGSDWVFGLHTALKNYDGEIQKFFDWIMPYVDEREGAFIGYSLYEEDDTPTLYFSNGYVGYKNEQT